MLFGLNFYLGIVIILKNCLALTLNFGFPSLLCFRLLEFMVKMPCIRFKCLQDSFVAEVLLRYSVSHKLLLWFLLLEETFHL
jgi:hypothetical protein